ncbi:hypothetical protein [endosymbiont GvMRE of Glomus versiforme]|uniref:hypothetical protein n=1 Tax=endosymbiont GvMRE of Glomus versiforme TaxID=2039283 RepID=UPI000EDBBD0A|nr:hypothetical protein [endosymbiont GvMRE of Glomus versiforme]RHZ36593.1 hypothetical protein GvMRE_I2g424 [endosymbiont GvMRE of Glomus versiforme]
MMKVKLPVNILKAVWGIAAVMETGAWTTKQTAWVGEKVAQVAESVSHYAKKGAEGIKNLNGWVEINAKTVKEQAEQSIREDEFEKLNQEITRDPAKLNSLKENQDPEFSDWVIVEHQEG